ncbi:MAG: hypothetical protein ACTSU5_14755 [Promethearchaeota archaeon]
MFPFTICRGWSGNYWPSKFDLDQKFVLFYGLFFDAEKCQYLSLSETGEVEVVAREIWGNRGRRDTSNFKLEVKHEFLRDYLYKTRLVLVRNHNHYRYFLNKLEEYNGTWKEKTAHYSIFRGSTVLKPLLTQEFEGISKLWGKDAVPMPGDGFVPLVGRKKQYEEFLIGTRGDGTQIKSTCNNKLLSYNSVDKGTPVYFKWDVLSKYRKKSTFK